MQRENKWLAAPIYPMGGDVNDRKNFLLKGD